LPQSRPFSACKLFEHQPQSLSSKQAQKPHKTLSPPAQRPFRKPQSNNAAPQPKSPSTYSITLDSLPPRIHIPAVTSTHLPERSQSSHQDKRRCPVLLHRFKSDRTARCYRILRRLIHYTLGEQDAWSEVLGSRHRWSSIFVVLDLNPGNPAVCRSLSFSDMAIPLNYFCCFRKREPKIERLQDVTLVSCCRIGDAESNGEAAVARSAFGRRGIACNAEGGRGVSMSRLDSRFD
jgi:hypothetical protein